MEDSITSRTMRALEVNAEYFGVSRLLLMENAGHSVALEVSSRFAPPKTVAVFCGLGGNGGDGFVVARHLSSMGFHVEVIVAGKAKDISDQASLKNWQSLRFLSETVTTHEVSDSTLIPKVDVDIVVDALLGTGSIGVLRPPILQMVEHINRLKAFRVAVDIPTGVDADTGNIMGDAVKADLTVTFYRMKVGLARARKRVGKLVVKDIGLPAELERFAGPGDAMLVISPRQSESHKGDFGRLMVIGGSEVYSGAPTLVAEAALRAGVDLAYVAAPEKTAYTISSLSPDLITIKLKGKQLNPGNISVLQDYMKRVDAVAMGPGLGLHPETKQAVNMLVNIVENARKPLLLDADGLKAFAGSKRKLEVPLVLTPHASEYAILTGKKTAEGLNQKTLGVRKAASELKAVILLKGPVDIISDGNHVKLNLTGNAGMTVGGTGDVLSGIVAGLLAQKADPFEAAVAGAYVNGTAGDSVFEEKGAHMVASDLIDWIPVVMNDPLGHLKVHRARGETR